MMKQVDEKYSTCLIEPGERCFYIDGDEVREGIVGEVEWDGECKIKGVCRLSCTVYNTMPEALSAMKRWTSTRWMMNTARRLEYFKTGNLWSGGT